MINPEISQKSALQSVYMDTHIYIHSVYGKFKNFPKVGATVSTHGYTYIYIRSVNDKSRNFSIVSATVSLHGYIYIHTQCK